MMFVTKCQEFIFSSKELSSKRGEVIKTNQEATRKGMALQYKSL
jgi:hypothetical protein